MIKLNKYEPQSEELCNLSKILLTDYGYQDVTAKLHENTKTIVLNVDDKSCSAFYADNTPETDLVELEIFLVDCVKNKEKIVNKGNMTFMSNYIFV